MKFTFGHCGLVALFCCTLMMAGCQSHPVVKLQPDDILVYRTIPSPIQSLRRLDPAGTVELEVHGDGSAHLRRVDRMGVEEFDKQLPHDQVEDFFIAEVEAGVENLNKNNEFSSEPLANGGQLAAGGELSAQIEGKTYRYFWPQASFPTQAEAVRAPIEKLIHELASGNVPASN